MFCDFVISRIEVFFDYNYSFYGTRKMPVNIDACAQKQTEGYTTHREY